MIAKHLRVYTVYNRQLYCQCQHSDDKEKD